MINVHFGHKKVHFVKKTKKKLKYEILKPQHQQKKKKIDRQGTRSYIKMDSDLRKLIPNTPLALVMMLYRTLIQLFHVFRLKDNISFVLWSTRAVGIEVCAGVLKWF